MGHSLGHLFAHDGSKAFMRHRPHRRILLQRIAKALGAHPCDSLFDESIIQAFMYINPFDPAAALPRIEHRPVHQTVHGSIKIGVRPDIAGVLATQFQPRAAEGASGGLFNRTAATDRAGEVDEVKGAVSDQSFRRGMVQHQILEHILRHTGSMEGLRETFAREQGLAGMFQHHGIARDQGGHDGVDRRQERVVPRRDHENHALGFAGDQTGGFGAVLDHFVGQRFGGDAGHVIGAFTHPAEFAAISHGAAHLPCQFGHDFGGHAFECCDPRQHGGDPRVKRQCSPRALCLARAGDSRLRIGQGQCRAFGINRPVHG